MTFQVGDIVAANIEGVFYKKDAVGVVTGANAHDFRIVVTFTSGAKHREMTRQLVTPSNFRLIPKG